MNEAGRLALYAVGGGIVGYAAWGGGAAVLTATAGAILFWAVRKSAVVAGLRGAALGVAFAALVGPGLDWLISGAPPTEKLVPAAVIGALVGATLGVRNFRKPRGVRSVEASVQEPGAVGPPSIEP